ncbi:Uncharacterised protein [Mycobacterium tuberculosis]|nr:Uncharacterised protein [Mycobacterium tuberculosis]
MVDRDERVRQDDRVRGDFCHDGLPEKNKRGIHVKTLEADGSGHVDRDRGNGDLRESEFADPDESPGDLYVECRNIDGLDVDGTDPANHLQVNGDFGNGEKGAGGEGGQDVDVVAR